MNVSKLLYKMRTKGIELCMDNGSLRADSTSPLNDVQRQCLKQHKTKILEYLVQLEASNQPNYTLWFYKIGAQCGYMRMGLKTADHHQAQKQLEAIYDKPITDLQRRQ